MTLRKRIIRLITGILMLTTIVLLVAFPDEGYLFVILFLDVGLILYGIRLLVYYFTMARYMVGGIMTFYKGVVALDFGVFVFNLDDAPKRMAMCYLIICLVFSGITDIFYAYTAKKINAGWKYELVYGIVKVLVGLSCFTVLDSANILVLVYSFGLLHTAIYNIITAFRKTAIVNIV